jgi:TRAP-type transport system small permease protein
MERVSLIINRLAHRISAAIMLVLVLLTVIDVTSRYLLNRPIRGTFELTEFAMVLIVFLALGYAQHQEDHVVIDLLYVRFPKSIQRFVRLMSSFISIAVIGLMTWQLYVYSGRMFAGNYTTAVLRIPLQPLVLIATTGAACFVLALVSTLFRHDGQERCDGNDS